MNAWLLRAPWWKLAFLMGLFLAVFWVIFFRLTGDHGWTAAILMGVGAAALCAPILGLMTAQAIGDSVAAIEDVPEHDRAVVERAARRGPVPQDDDQRLAALRLVEDRLLTLLPTRTRALSFPVVLVLVTGFFAVAHSPWWWIAVAGSLALVIPLLVVPRRLERRAELLRDGGR